MQTGIRPVFSQALPEHTPGRVRMRLSPFDAQYRNDKSGDTGERFQYAALYGSSEIIVQ